MKRLFPTFTVLAFFLLGFCGFLLRASDYFSAVPGDIGDARFNSVVLEHIHQWTEGNAESFWSPRYFYPFENALAFSDSLIGSACPYLLFRRCSLGREMAFTGWVFVGVCSSFIAAYFALRQLPLSGEASGAGAFVFAYALPLLNQVNHAQLTYRFPIPLACVSWWRFFEERQPRLFCWTVFWLSLQFLCSIYLGVFLTFLLLAMVLAKAAIPTERDDELRAAIKTLGHGSRRCRVARCAIVILCLLPTVMLLVKHHNVAREYRFRRSKRELKRMRPRLSSYLVADATYPWLAPAASKDLPMRHEHQLFFGFGPWLFLFAGVFVLRGQGPTAVMGRQALFAAAVLFLLTLDVHGRSLYGIVTRLPGMLALRSVSRIVLVMLWPIALVNAITIHTIIQRVGKHSAYFRCIAMLLTMGVLATDVAMHEPHICSIASWQQRMQRVAGRLPRQLPKDAIIYVTSEKDEPYYCAELDGMVFAQDRGLATLNGYSGNAPAHWSSPQPQDSYKKRLELYALLRGQQMQPRIETMARRVVVTEAKSLPSK